MEWLDVVKICLGLLGAGAGGAAWFSSRANRTLIQAQAKKLEVEALTAVLVEVRKDRDYWQAQAEECRAQRERERNPRPTPVELRALNRAAEFERQERGIEASIEAIEADEARGRGGKG